MSLIIPDEHRDARSQATIDYADSSGAGSYIALLDVDDITLASIILDYPCGQLEGGLIRLKQLASIGDQIVVDGAAVKGEWRKSNHAVVAEGTVTDAAGTGDFKITSAAGTSLYAGGYVLLGTTSLS